MRHQKNNQSHIIVKYNEKKLNKKHHTCSVTNQPSYYSTIACTIITKMSNNNVNTMLELEKKLTAADFTFMYDAAQNCYVVNFQGGVYGMSINMYKEEGATHDIMYKLFLLENDIDQPGNVMTPFTLISLGYDKYGGKKVNTIDDVIKAMSEIWLYVKINCLDLKRKLGNKTKS